MLKGVMLEEDTPQFKPESRRPHWCWTNTGYKGHELLAPIRLKVLRFLVTGTGRCGTVSVAKILSHAGVPCGHESIFDHQGIGIAKERLEGRSPIELSKISKLASHEEESLGVFWFNHADNETPIDIVGDSSYMAAPFIDDPVFDKVKIIHVVREPIKVINSFVEGFKYFKYTNEPDGSEAKPYHDFIYKHVPQLKEPMDPLTRAAIYYIHWNTMIEKKAKSSGRQYMLHRIEDTNERLMKFIGAARSTYKVPMEWGTCNHKWGLEPVYDNYDCIPNVEVRNTLLKLRNKYYSKQVLI